jgi:hypothetical protein
MDHPYQDLPTRELEKSETGDNDDNNKEYNNQRTG